MPDPHSPSPAPPAVMPPAVVRDDPRSALSRATAAWHRRVSANSTRTGQCYGRLAEELLSFIERTRGPLPDSLAEFSPADASAFVNLHQRLAPASRAVRAAVMRSLFGALVLEGLIARNPASDVRVRNVQSGNHHKAVPQSAIITVLERLAASDRIKDIRDRALLLLALAVGARRFELGVLNVGSIEAAEGEKALVSFRGKGSKVARMLIRPNVMQAINVWLSASGHGTDPSKPLFVCLSRRPEHRGRRLSGSGILHIVKGYFPQFSVHGLRSRSITDIWQRSNSNIGVAQQFARHSNPVTTEAYVQCERMNQATEYAFDYGEVGGRG